MISQNVRRLLGELPAGVELVAAAKSQPPERVLEAVEAGIRTIGENYVQEAAVHAAALGRRAAWHFIGHLQTNKAGKAVGLFDMIETVDTAGLASAIASRAAAAGRTMDMLIEVNSGREPQKFGVLPEDVEALARAVASMPGARLKGLMTMGPFEGNPEAARPYFRETRSVFDRLRRLALPGIEMTVLSMGMTNSFRIAIEEGATMVRVGTGIFGPRA
jgi:PLP dependent protein